MSVPQRWQAGSPVLLRETWQGRVWTARPVTVVQDTPDLIALYMMPGTRYKHPRVVGSDRVPTLLTDSAWHLVDLPWHGGGALYLSTPGAPYMIIGFRSDDNARLARWYVNLQTPLRRTALGFDYLDQELDIVMSLDLTSWRWKDEEGFAALQQRGVIATADAARLRAVGEAVIRQRYATDSLLQQGWEHWSPPTTWTIPGLPSGWDEVA